MFYYDENDKTSKDNDGTIIISDGRRWKRENTYLMEPEFFGAKGDGSTDDTTALQNALDASINKVLILAPKNIVLEISLLMVHLLLKAPEDESMRP
ncbi:hypothetical protein ACHWUR_02630 [Klebsiella pneumoniae]